MSGKNEIPKGLTFEDGVDFPRCVYCQDDFKFWRCYGAISTIYFNPKSFAIKFTPSKKGVVIYTDEAGDVLARGRYPELRELSRIVKITCDFCGRTPSNEMKSLLMKKAIDYLIYVKRLDGVV